jgi:2-phospho-L-lactate guanylyltransferase
VTAQGTVSSYDQRTRSGSVLLDDGSELPFTEEALADSGLRLLRPGQRVRLSTTPDGKVTAVQILTLP